MRRSCYTASSYTSRNFSSLQQEIKLNLIKITLGSSKKEWNNTPSSPSILKPTVLNENEVIKNYLVLGWFGVFAIFHIHKLFFWLNYIQVTWSTILGHSSIFSLLCVQMRWTIFKMALCVFLFISSPCCSFFILSAPFYVYNVGEVKISACETQSSFLAINLGLACVPQRLNVSFWHVKRQSFHVSDWYTRCLCAMHETNKHATTLDKWVQCTRGLPLLSVWSSTHDVKPVWSLTRLDMVPKYLQPSLQNKHVHHFILHTVELVWSVIPRYLGPLPLYILINV